MKIGKRLTLIFLLNFAFCYQNLFSEKIYFLAHPTNFIVGEINKGEKTFKGKEINIQGLNDPFKFDYNYIIIESFKSDFSTIDWSGGGIIPTIETVSVTFQDGTKLNYLINNEHKTVGNLKNDIRLLREWANDKIIFPKQIKTEGQNYRFYEFDDYKRPAYQILLGSKELADTAELINGMELVFGIKNEKWEITIQFFDDKNEPIAKTKTHVMNLDTIYWLKYQLLTIILGIEYNSTLYQNTISVELANSDEKNFSKSFHEVGYDNLKSDERIVKFKGVPADKLKIFSGAENILLDWGTAISLITNFVKTGEIKLPGELVKQEDLTKKIITEFTNQFTPEEFKSKIKLDDTIKKQFISEIIKDGITAYLLGKLLYLTVKPNNMETIQEPDISKELTKISKKIITHMNDFLKLEKVFSVTEPDLKTYLEKNYGPKIEERIKLILDLAVEFAEPFNIKKEDPRKNIKQRIFEGSFEYDKIPEKLALVFINYYYNDINSKTIDVSKISNAFHFSWIPDIYKGKSYSTIRSAINKKDILVLDDNTLQSNLIQLRTSLIELKDKTHQLQQKLEALKTRLK